MENATQGNLFTMTMQILYRQTLLLRRKHMHFFKPVCGEIRAKHLLVSLSFLMSWNVLAQANSIGFVDVQRLLSESKIAQESLRGIGEEFKSRDRALETLAGQIRSAAERLERDRPILGEADLSQQQRELLELRVQFERKERDLREDVEQRRQEEIARLLKSMNTVIQQLAKERALDLVVQEAIFVTKAIDLTDSVLQALEQ